MLARFLHLVAGAAIGGIIASGVMTFWQGEITDWDYVYMAAGAAGVVGFLFGYPILDTFKSVVKLR